MPKLLICKDATSTCWPTYRIVLILCQEGLPKKTLPLKVCLFYLKATPVEQTDADVPREPEPGRLSKAQIESMAGVACWPGCFSHAVLAVFGGFLLLS